MIIDGTNAVLGRLSSAVAKSLLNGEKILIINSEKVLVSGNAVSNTKKYADRRKIGSAFHGPFFPVKPDAILRRTIRGMLPSDKKRGLDAIKLLKVYVGTPDELKGEEIKQFGVKSLKSRYSTLYEVSKSMGWKVK